jgi:hypothetical protein
LVPINLISTRLILLLTCTGRVLLQILGQHSTLSLAPAALSAFSQPLASLEFIEHRSHQSFARLQVRAPPPAVTGSTLSVSSTPRSEVLQVRAPPPAVTGSTLSVSSTPRSEVLQVRAPPPAVTGSTLSVSSTPRSEVNGVGAQTDPLALKGRAARVRDGSFQN